MGPLLITVLLLAIAGFVASARIVQQYERGLVFRLGRLQDKPRGPGLVLIVPVVDRMQKVNLQIVTMPVPAQDGITRDNVTVTGRRGRVLPGRRPGQAAVNVQDYLFAVLQVAQTSLRSVIGKTELDDLLSNRERLNQGLEVMIDSPALAWGIQIDRVEIKDVSLPESMKRSMSRQAEAERERRARVITADGEFQASKKLADAAADDGAIPRRPCSCGCCRRWSRWRRRRTAPWSCRSRSSCSASWTSRSRREPRPRHQRRRTPPSCPSPRRAAACAAAKMGNPRFDAAHSARTSRGREPAGEQRQADVPDHDEHSAAEQHVFRGRCASSETRTARFVRRVRRMATIRRAVVIGAGMGGLSRPGRLPRRMTPSRSSTVTCCRGFRPRGVVCRKVISCTCC